MTEEPEVLSSRDYCTALAEYLEIDRAARRRPGLAPSTRSSCGGALRDLANIAPPAVKDSWAFWRDLYERDRAGYFEGGNLSESEQEAAFSHLENITTHAENVCGIDTWSVAATGRRVTSPRTSRGCPRA